MPYSLAAINQMDRAQFVECVGWVFEHSPWVAERASHRRPFESFDRLCDCMNSEAETASMDERLALLPTMRRGLEAGVEFAAPAQAPYESPKSLIQEVVEVARPIQRPAE